MSGSMQALKTREPSQQSLQRTKHMLELIDHDYMDGATPEAGHRRSGEALDHTSATSTLV